uniref:Adenylate kinase n=1 Tax=Guillardia theta (strain CCMP2712) TaxID=905079 RepID=A0A0C3SJ09_GUITC
MILLAGKPCSGKGTQAPLISRKYRCVHISTGDLLRAEMKVGSELGARAFEYVKEGKLLPDDLVISIVKKRIEQDDCIYHGWILDGFPRTVEQAKMLIEEKIIPDHVIILDRPDEVVREWCSGECRSFDASVVMLLLR